MNVALATMFVDRRNNCAKITMDHSSVSVNQEQLEMGTNVKVLIELKITNMHPSNECHRNLRGGKCLQSEVF